MKIALAQLQSSTDPSANLDLVRQYTARAAAQGAEMVVFPEATMHSFAAPPARAAEALDGLWATAVRSIAREHGLTIVAGMFTTTASHRVRNTLLVTGAVEAHYDKIHLFDALGHTESETIEAGTEPLVVEVGGARLGFAICYDVRFPEQFTQLARLGAEAIVVAASWASGPHKVHQWRTAATARAMDSASFVIACGQARPEGPDDRRPIGVGHSLVVDPFGTVLLELGDDPELGVVEIDLAAVEAARESVGVLRNARLSGR